MGTLNQALKKPARDLRLNPGHALASRNKIRAGWLISRLMKIARGRVVVTDVQLKAIQTLLNKVLPDAPREIQGSWQGKMTLTVLTCVPQGETIDGTAVTLKLEQSPQASLAQESVAELGAERQDLASD